MEKIGSTNIRFLFNQLVQMMKDRSNEKEISDMEAQAFILSRLLEHKLSDIKLLGMQVDIIK